MPISNKEKPITAMIMNAARQLREAGIENPMPEARLLLGHYLGIPIEKIIMGDFFLDAAQEKEFQKLIERRKRREPVSHITGAREFYGREFKVTRDTLDPRADSETLIEAALEIFPEHRSLISPLPLRLGEGQGEGGERVKFHFSSPLLTSPRRRGEEHCSLKILDLGTGSGCLILTLLKEFPAAHGFAVDISQAAIIVARENSVKLGLEGRVNFTRGFWGEGLDQKFDLIISNPPYIKKSAIEYLMPEVRVYEPHAALDGGADGLRCYRELLPIATRLLSNNGFIILEIGEGQKTGVCRIAEENNLSFVSSHKDLAGTIRCLVFKNNR